MKTSLCDNNSECCVEAPCDQCYKDGNRFIVAAQHCDFYFFGPQFCNRDGGGILNSTTSFVFTTLPMDDRRVVAFKDGKVVHISDIIPDSF